MLSRFDLFRPTLFSGMCVRRFRVLYGPLGSGGIFWRKRLPAVLYLLAGRFAVRYAQAKFYLDSVLWHKRKSPQNGSWFVDVCCLTDRR